MVSFSDEPARTTAPGCCCCSVSAGGTSRRRDVDIEAPAPDEPRRHSRSPTSPSNPPPQRRCPAHPQNLEDIGIAFAPRSSTLSGRHRRRSVVPRRRYQIGAAPPVGVSAPALPTSVSASSPPVGYRLVRPVGSRRYVAGVKFSVGKSSSRWRPLRRDVDGVAGNVHDRGAVLAVRPWPSSRPPPWRGHRAGRNRRVGAAGTGRDRVGARVHLEVSTPSPPVSVSSPPGGQRVVTGAARDRVGLGRAVMLAAVRCWSPSAVGACGVHQVEVRDVDAREMPLLAVEAVAVSRPPPWRWPLRGETTSLRCRRRLGRRW